MANVRTRIVVLWLELGGLHSQKMALQGPILGPAAFSELEQVAAGIVDHRDERLPSVLERKRFTLPAEPGRASLERTHVAFPLFCACAAWVNSVQVGVRVPGWLTGLFAGMGFSQLFAFGLRRWREEWGPGEQHIGRVRSSIHFTCASLFSPQSHFSAPRPPGEPHPFDVPMSDAFKPVSLFKPN